MTSTSSCAKLEQLLTLAWQRRSNLHTAPTFWLGWRGLHWDLVETSPHAAYVVGSRLCGPDWVRAMNSSVRSLRNMALTVVVWFILCLGSALTQADGKSSRRRAMVQQVDVSPPSLSDAPWNHHTWKNSVALCATMMNENVTDVTEWLNYYRYAVCFARLQSVR